MAFRPSRKIGVMSFNPPGNQPNENWPETPAELTYNLDRVLELFARIQNGEPIDLLEGLLDCADWREMFGSTGSGLLKPDDIAQIKTYYRTKFGEVNRFYLAEQLSTELMTALMSNGNFVFSDPLKAFGRDNPALWQEIRAFFGRKEFSTAQLVLADERGSG
ncbi:hypothetical protein BH20CHL1_BH20CHL1_05760 [soil metagenome]